MGGAQLKVIVAILALVILGLSVAFAIYYVQKVDRPQKENYQALQEEPPPPPDPGISTFERAGELLRDGQPVAAREKLLYLMQYYPDSSRYLEAKRIVGEINVDLLFSRDKIDGKSEHSVTRGESLGSIARKSGSTIDYIKRVNGMFGLVIHKGDQLMVFDLDFTAKMSRSKKVLALYHKGRFFKEYPVLGAMFSPGTRLPLTTELKSKSAWLGSKSVSMERSGSDFQLTKKWLQFARSGIVIRDEPEKKEEKDDVFSPGIFLADEDVEELYTILRSKTPLEITD